MLTLDSFYYPKPELTYPYGKAALKGNIKLQNSDFKVIEQLGFEPSGEGEHLYLWVEKQGITTDQASQKLAQHYQVKPYHISYCGLKDAHAVTLQWFSVHLPKIKELPSIPVLKDLTILKQSWSAKKIKTGVHQSNRFELTIRNLEGDIESAKLQIEAIIEYGFANYFGDQRFGNGYKNVTNAMKSFALGNKIGRSKRSLFLSSLRSFLFNLSLDLRIKNSYWKQPVEGDCFMLDGSRSIFSEPLDASIIKRHSEMDIHPIIGLIGEGEAHNHGLALSYENEIYQKYPEIVSELKHQGLQIDKRSIRQRAQYLEYEFLGNDFKISFDLAKGCYATTVLSHFCEFY